MLGMKDLKFIGDVSEWEKKDVSRQYKEWGTGEARNKPRSKVSLISRNKGPQL